MIAVDDLSQPTRDLLAKGVDYWGDGPASLNPAMLALLGFIDRVSAQSYLLTLAEGLKTAGRMISVLDLTRALLLTEIGATSYAIGPRDWHNVYGGGDYDESRTYWARLLHSAQSEVEMSVLGRFARLPPNAEQDRL